MTDQEMPTAEEIVERITKTLGFSVFFKASGRMPSNRKERRLAQKYGKLAYKLRGTKREGEVIDKCRKSLKLLK